MTGPHKVVRAERCFSADCGTSRCDAGGLGRSCGADHTVVRGMIEIELRQGRRVRISGAVVRRPCRWTRRCGGTLTAGQNAIRTEMSCSIRVHSA